MRRRDLSGRIALPRAVAVSMILLALGYSASWGVGVTLSKIGLNYFRPMDLLLVELTSSVVLLSVLHTAHAGKGAFQHLSFKNGVAGILEPGMAYLFGTLGLSLTSAVSASLIGTSEVIVTILVAALLLRERVSRVRLLLAAVGTAGVLMVSGADAVGAGQTSAAGDALVFLSVLCAVAYTIVSAPVVRKVEPLALVTVQQIFGLLTVIPVWAAFRTPGPLLPTTSGSPLGPWAIAIVSGASQYALSYFLYLRALQKMEVNRATLFLILIPVFASASAVALLGETVTPLQAVGGGVILVTTYFASREPGSAKAP